jgi:hypothetical protein
MTGLLRLIFGGGLAEQLRLAYQARLAAQNDSEKIAAEIEIARLEARGQVLAQGGRWVTAVQVAWALPFILYNAKLVVWDKILGLGVTDPLSPALYELQGTIVAFFFVATTARTILNR